MRGGQVLDRREFFWEGRQRVEAAAVLAEVLPQIYDRTSFIPKEIHLPMAIDGSEALAQWLGERRGNRVYLRLPARGTKAHRVALAMHNARLAFLRRFRRRAEELEAINLLAEVLELPEPPSRIEGFDVSNLQGSETVGSLVVWEGGKMKKSDYRSFNIRGLSRPDDYAAIRQMVKRRYRRRLEELGTMPDLILIDGGRGQLNAAIEALTELGVEETPIVGLAKREEEIYLASKPEPLRLGAFHGGLKILQQIRDEAHRFAVDRHRRRRSRRSLASVLDELPGIGPGRRKKLLVHFGSLAGVEAASMEEIQQLLGPRTGERLHGQLHRGASVGAAPSQE
jgi:excinuclease ABC subunit C